MDLFNRHQLTNRSLLKMKLAIVFAAILAVTSAQFQGFPGFPSTRLPPRPTPTPGGIVRVVNNNDQAANIVRYDNDIGPDGSFSYAFDTDNGISAQAQGTPRDFGGNPPVVPVVHQGAFSWTSPEGEPIAISYTADENGYQPTGNAIPTPPPIPAAIARALDYLAKYGPAKK